MKMNKKTLKTLLELPGISGREELVSEFLKNEIEKNNLDLKWDNLGSVWGVKKSLNPEAKTLFIDAHMDEVGFMVTKINDRGFISFENQGGIWNKTLVSQRLRVWTDNYEKSYSGIVLIPGANTHQQNGKTPSIDEFLLDIGASSKKEIENLGIKIGSVITFDTKTEFNGKRVISKAADNRVGVSMVVQLMEFISERDFDYNIIIGGSTQEEVGLRGARTSTYKFDPDLAFVIDVSPAMDIPTPKYPDGVVGEGTMLRHKDASTIYSPNAIDYIRDIAIKNKVKIQDYFSKGGTNAGVIHLWKNGRTVFPFGIVSRNLHTGSSVFDINDYEETLKLIESILKDLNSDKIVKFK